MQTNILKIRQLDKRFKKLKILLNYPPPKKGWIDTIRKALMITRKQLSKKMNVSEPLIAKMEKNEVEGAITLKSIRRISEAMNCKFVYAIIPNESLENIINQQIEKVVAKMINEVDQTMKLEAQGTSNKTLENEQKRLKFELKENLKSKIWDYEV